MNKIFALRYLVLLPLFFTLNIQGQEINSTDSIDFDSMSNFEQVELLSKLCWQNREKNTELAIDFGLRGIAIAKENNYNKELGKLYNYLGVVYQHYKEDSPTAISYYNMGLKLSLQVKDSIEIAYVYNNLGDAFYKIGNIQLALEYANKSMLLFKQLENKRGIAYSYINLGMANRINLKYGKALEYFNKAIELRKTFNDSIGIASATLEVGRTLYYMDSLDVALQYFKKSLELHQKLHNLNYMAYSFHGLGDVFYKKMQLDSAGYYFNEALKLSNERHNPSSVIENMLDIAIINARENRAMEGEKILNEALRSAKKSGLTKSILETYKKRGEFYYYLEKYQKASENYQYYIEIYDSLFLALQHQNLSEIKDRFAITEQLNNINENLKEKQKEQYYSITIIILLIIIAFVLVYKYRTISKLTRDLKQTNQAKNKIFSIVGHDLVSPFNVIIGSIDLLLEDLEEKDYESAKNNGKLIQQTSNETFNLISNLLNWARSQQNKIIINKVKFNISLLMHEVKSNFINQAKNKNIELAVITDEEVEINADKNLIKIVLVNLLNNAIKFTNNNGIIKLSTTINNEAIRISVIDNGIGISNEKINLILNHQNIISTPGTKSEKGTGLGLILCNEFIEMHNGKLIINSEEGEGSEFAFSIPLS